MSDVQAEESYEANTVAELRDELSSRGLHTSGNKDELIARLEEDDAKEAAGEPEAQIEAEDEAEVVAEEATVEPQDYYPPTVYNVHELPANTAAAQAFIDANPEAVDPTLAPLDPPERQEAALANIQDHVDTMAAMGVTVEDPRLGSTPPDPPDPPPVEEPTITGVEPTSGPEQTVNHIVVTGTGLTDAQQVYIGSKSCHNTVVNDDTSIDTDTDGNTSAGTFPVTVHMKDQSVITGPDYTFT
jgi:hypothetical protein